jgi:hypothetical protein
LLQECIDSKHQFQMTNVFTEAAMFEWAGIDFGEEEVH